MSAGMASLHPKGIGGLDFHHGRVSRQLEAESKTPAGSSGNDAKERNPEGLFTK